MRRWPSRPTQFQVHGLDTTENALPGGAGSRCRRISDRAHALKLLGDGASRRTTNPGRAGSATERCGPGRSGGVGLEAATGRDLWSPRRRKPA